MYPDLSYILSDLFGTPVDNGFSIIKTFGLLLVLAFLASAYVLTLELKRKEAMGLLPSVSIQTKADKIRIWDIITNSLLIFILGYKLPYVIRHVNLLKSDPAGTVLSKNGDLTIGLIAASITLIWMIFKKRKLEANAPLVTKIIRPHERVARHHDDGRHIWDIRGKIVCCYRKQRSPKAISC